ncbi:thiol reductant ABC exporter subunit CydD [Pseudarthrobacter sulfonivorans]|uniref:thiol reductant ABC exporter subunit CydD n=1 Tax=Pseudarthrobacter sulfonivorans TaxID=121292 RepID=UPI002856391D|nr:thiol reductant ABC exporter subunit CydD [Pseudarthrobacter sulfonivorans]MDR6417162.1 ATP-binding cassette subfamily C protein CydCD [Pseudarthrobacter sulfonivorans]
MRPDFPAGPATRSAIYWLGLLAALKALSLVLMGQAVAAMLAGLATGNESWQDQLPWGLAGVVLRSATVWAQGIAARRAALGIKEELRSELLARALRNGARSTGPADGGLAILATRGLDALDSYYTQFLPALVNCATIPLLLGARILFADWVSAVVVVLTVPLVPLFMVLIGRYTEDHVREAQETLTRLSAHMLELAKGLPVLVGLGRATAQRKALEEISEEYRSRTMGTLRTAFLSALALELIATISVAVVAVFIGVRLVHGDMALEAGLLALILAPDCYLPLRELGTAHHASDDGRAALAATRAVTEAPEPRPLPADGPESAADTAAALPAAAAPEDDDGRRLAAPVSPGVTVTDLTVTYAGRSAAAVGPLTFTAPHGRITALDGPSGAGKSTVLGVLAGTVGDGGGTAVTGHLSGVDRGAIAWVPQHPVMVADSVLEEVMLYVSGGSGSGETNSSGPGPDVPGMEETARECLAAAAAGHLAGNHPAELSPGELRRVALARGLARLRAGATVLLLDEPTAHLDAVSATLVQDSIRALRGQATVILVAHDQQTREVADHLVPVSARGITARGITAPSGIAGLPDAAVNLPGPGSAAQASAGQQPGPTAAGRATLQPMAGDEQPVPTNRLLASLLAPVAGRFSTAAVVGTFAAIFAVALSGLSGWLIIRASEQPPILYLLTAIVGVRFFGIGRAVLRYWERLLLHDAVFGALTRLRGQLWESLSRKALSLRRILQGGNVLGTVIDDVDTVRDLLPRVVLPPLTALAVGGSALLATTLVAPAALPAVATAAALGLVVAPLAALWGDRRSATAEQRLRAGVLRRTSAALDARAELHANSIAATVLDALRSEDRTATKASQRSAWAEGLGQAITVAACGTAALAAAVLTAPQVIAGALEPATAAVVVLLQLALVEPYAAMTTAVRQYPALRAVLRRVAGSGVLGDTTAETAEGDGVHAVPPRPCAAPGVELTNLGAAWPGGGTVFAGVSATAEPGSWLAVTGPSGSGKSTLLAVLLGFLPAYAGRAAVTGTAAWCPQEAHLFDSTLRGNLLLGLPADRNSTPGSGGAASSDAALGDAGLAAALTAVGLDALVSRLPEGLDTRIGPGGSFLSGGERQRLAVARTILTGAEVILLDEPTAHLDAEAGREMLADLRAGLKDRTVVMVTHNPADIDPSDTLLDLSAASLTGGPAGDRLLHPEGSRQ